MTTGIRGTPERNRQKEEKKIKEDKERKILEAVFAARVFLRFQLFSVLGFLFDVSWYSRGMESTGSVRV